MNQQPHQQQPASQSQGSQPTPLLPQSQPKKPRHLSKESKVAIIVAIIGAVGVVLAATIPVVIQLVKPSSISNGLTSPVTITSSLSPNAYSPVGWKPLYSDPMKSNSSGYWHVSAHGLAGNAGICTFANDVYQVNTIKGFFHRCENAYYDLTDFAIEVQMTIVNGDQGGIEFRLDDQTANYYFFWISAAGTYGLEIWDNDYLTQTLSSGSNAAIHNGFNQPNTVAVVAKGNTFKLYANNQLLDTVTDKDSSYGHGKIALEASSNSNPTEVLFSNVKVWAPSS